MSDDLTDEEMEERAGDARSTQSNVNPVRSSFNRKLSVNSIKSGQLKLTTPMISVNIGSKKRDFGHVNVARIDLNKDSFRT